VFQQQCLVSKVVCRISVGNGKPYARFPEAYEPLILLEYPGKQHLEPFVILPGVLRPSGDLYQKFGKLTVGLGLEDLECAIRGLIYSGA